LIPLLQNITSLVKERGLIALIPLHPRLAKVAEGNREVSELLKSDWIVTTPPVSYGETISLIKMSQFVLTDSGGIQKEAAMLGKKVLVLRTETEWVEWVEAGFAFVVSNELDRMRQALKESKAVRQAPNILKQKAAPIILQTIKNDLS
jgi:UDP-N-acetylglucosamine 2-epimerase